MHSVVTYDLLVLALGAIAFGFYLLMKGGDWAIDAAVYLAENAGLSKLFVGATILAFGTSVPELFASVNANLAGFPGISIGNVIGSNVANILLVLGATALIFPVMCKPRDVMPDILMMLLASFALLGVMQGDVIGRGTGFLFFAVLLAFVLYQYKTGQNKPSVEEDSESIAGAAEQLLEDSEHEVQYKSKATALGFLLAGFVLLAVGSELLVKGAVTIGLAFGVPEAIIGMTVVAFGTSLPELATCLAAAAKKHTQMLIGNIIGSNVFNILSIVGITAMIKPIAVDANLTGFSLYTMVAVAVLIAGWLLLGRRLNRTLGIVMTCAYVAFIGMQYLS